MRDEKFNDIFSMIKSVGCALAISLLGAVIFAVILRACSLSDTVIYPVNQTIKSVALAVGVMLFVRGERGWLKGGVIGLLFTAVSYLAFSAIGNDFSLSWLIFAELAIAFLVGAICGSLAVNMKK